jgi:hypothetical protein
LNRTATAEIFVREIVSYLVRIYRHDGDAIAGLVEQVRSGKTAPFATLAELSELLSGRRSFARRPLRHRTAPSATQGEP